MARSLREVMSSKSEDGLMDYLINFNKYTADSITAAVDELKRRGKSFTEEELRDIKSKIETNYESIIRKNSHGRGQKHYSSCIR